MISSTVNFTTSGTSTNSSTQSFTAVTVLDICVYNIHFLFGFPTHSYVIWLIITGAGSGVASEFFRLNLSVCEIVYSLYSLVNMLECIFPWFSRLGTITWFLIGFAITGRPLFQCLICVERYLAVIHPVTFLKFKPLRYRVICCTVAWIITLCSCFCIMLTLLSSYYYIYVCYYAIQYSLFLSIQLFCCLTVLRALKQSGPGERGREREEENNMKRRAFHLILITTVSMTISYVPFIITGFSFILSQQDSGECASAVFFCFVLVTFVQPFLYLHRTGKLSCLFFIKNVII